MRSYSAREMVCFVALVESSTMKVDLVLRESTLALTTTLPNSVTWLLGIFSVSSRSRPAAGLNSTCAALTSYTTAAPPRWRKRRERSACGVAPVRAAQRAPGRAGFDLGSVPRSSQDQISRYEGGFLPAGKELTRGWHDARVRTSQGPLT